MEAIQEQIAFFVQKYNGFWEYADKRTADWFLMQSYTPTLVLTAVYLLIVTIGPIFMRSREPFTFRWTLFFYNIGLVMLNFHICFELFTVTWKLNYSYTCQLIDDSDNPDELRVAKALWWYYFSKFIEFLDTIFFVLRKKNNQISFLHVYHHATMFPIWWIGLKWVPGGQSFFGAMINSFIHVLMYTYYGIAALGPQFQKYLWWKRYLTRLQLVQFIVGMTHAGISIYSECPFPRWMQWALVTYGFSILLLFSNFYFHAYMKPSKPQEPKPEKAAAIKNGHVETSTNGHLANGYTNHVKHRKSVKSSNHGNGTGGKKKTRYYT